MEWSLALLVLLHLAHNYGVTMFNPFKIDTAPFEKALTEAQASKYLILHSKTGAIYEHKTNGTSVRNEAIKYLLGTKQIEFSYETPITIHYNIVSKAAFSKAGL